MPVKQFEIPLADGHYVAINLAICWGRLTSFVVRLMLRDDMEDVCMARYDTAHGCPHRDLVSRTGRLLQKDWLTEMTLAEAANHAIQDFKENHETYFRQFKARD